MMRSFEDIAMKVTVIGLKHVIFWQVVDVTVWIKKWSRNINVKMFDCFLYIASDFGHLNSMSYTKGWRAKVSN